MNNMFIVYEYYILAQNPKKSLSDELQEQFKDKDANEVIQDFIGFVQLYKNQIFDNEDKNIYAFWYLRWSIYWKAILMAGLHTKYKEYSQLVVLLKRFYYLYWIAGKTLTKVKQLSFNIIGWVKENRSINYIEEQIEKKLLKDNIVAQAYAALKSEDIYNTAWSKPLLLLIEYGLTDDSKLSFIELSKDLHLEHILPKKYDRFDEWSHINEATARKWMNSSGNLTLLSGKKNIEASNNPFKEKISVYRGKGKYDNKNTKITSFLMTQEIVNAYDKSVYSKEWTDTAMIDRQQWFCEHVNELFCFI